MALEARYTFAEGPGDGDSGTPSGSLGAYASQDAWPGGIMYDLYGLVSSVDADDNRADYRCLFLYNPDADLTDVRVYVTAVTDGGDLAVGIDPRPVSAVDSTAPQATEVSSAYTAPSGVTFTTPADYATGVVAGDLPTGYGRALWVRRTPSITNDAAAEACDVTVEHDGGVSWTKRVYWPVEPAVTPTTPSAPGYDTRFVPTPSPFSRVCADFVGESGARITWVMDSTMTDDGPYDFQLQVSMSGVPDADDWVDVGPPARDAAYLIDPTARLWGMSSTLHYRVHLTTADGSYTSTAANVFGVLGQRDWLHVREIFRKERMYQRELVGRTGFLLKAKRYGTYCSCVDPSTHEVGNSSCPTCYGQGIVGGYHPPVAAAYTTASPEDALEIVEYNENLGTTRKVTVLARILADLPIVHRDAWVSASGSDERYTVWKVKEVASWMDVPIVYEVELRLAPRSDVLYTVPVTRPDAYAPSWRTEERLSL